MFRKTFVVVSWMLIVMMLVPQGVIMQDFQIDIVEIPNATGIFRVEVTYPNAAGGKRLDNLGVILLEPRSDGALILATGMQLESLARLGFRPRHANDLGELMSANAATMPDMARELVPSLEYAAVLWKSVEPDIFSPQLSIESQHALGELNKLMSSLSASELSAIAMAPSADADGDGLTDTEEAWWCTDPMNPNTDGDVHGYTDYEEITALLDVTLPRGIRWGYGPPFGPPAPWPDWNGMDGDPNTPACNDGDWDTIPDYAEAYVIGSRVPAESTDGDKFDDGQEFFGITYCPGAPTNCGYGSYPAIEYWNFIQASMPAWVEPPGDNIFVAAFPVPEVSVVPGSWKVNRVTNITTEEGEMVQTTNSYETSVMKGQSTSIANTVTWNEWEEVSEAVERPMGQQIISPEGFWNRAWGAAQLVIGMGVAGGSVAVAGALCSTGIGCPLGVAAVAAGGALGGAIAGAGWSDLTGPDEVQNQVNINQYDLSTMYYDYSSPYYDMSTSVEQNSYLTLNQQFDDQRMAQSLDGIQYAINQQGELLAHGLQDISYQLSRPRFTETRTNGRSWGGSQTTTHEAYEEHTITQGEAFTSGQNWSTAWAVDSSHAADLTWTYRICNTGTEYAREITGLVFNVYLGDDTEPLISYPAWEQFPNGKIENFFPGDCAEFTTSPPAALTLDQMRRIDLGERLTVVLEDFSYGADELFYQNAVNGGVTVFIEDGVDDGDELVDTYVIPTWGSESVQDVLTRYFPAGVDADGNINSLWTPEFDGINPPVWNEHFLSDIAWWNVYLTQPDAGDSPLQDLPAQAGSGILFRFNRDSDRDGYKDSVELRYGTDKNDPASHPQPEITAGYVKSRDGDVVTVLLKIGNSGSFDAYGIDAVMYAPDDTVAIGNNTVGGNGRVRPGHQVAVGSLILDPELDNWDDSTAKPYVGGNYTGADDLTFTFSVQTPGVVGQSGTALQWSDGTRSGTIAFGDTYHAPLPMDVVDGLQVGFDTGTFMAGDSFTVQALTPRDTFTYTVNSDPYTEPVIVVSYSDPQGSHRFITPVELPDLNADLSSHTSEMLVGARLEILTTDGVSPGMQNKVHFIFDSPHPVPIKDAHLYLNFVSNGVLQAELPYTMTLYPGPTIHTVNWSTDIFSDAYNADADNILIAFWTDSQGNIIDSAARPLDTFQEDPQAEAVVVDSSLTWDFGAVRQGTFMQHRFQMGNTGFRDLLTYLENVDGISIEGPVAGSLSPADMAIYTVTIDTQDLPIGDFNATIPIHTSDIAAPDKMINIRGTVVSNVLANQVQVTHLEDVFGNGGDGDLTVGTGQTVYVDSVRTLLVGNASLGEDTVYVASTSGFQIGDEVLIIQIQGVGAGNYEFKRIVSINTGWLVLNENLQHDYITAGSAAQVIRVPQYKNVIVRDGGILTAHPWDGNTGGVVAFRVSQELIVEPNGVIHANGIGYRHGSRGDLNVSGGQGGQAESYSGIGGFSINRNYGGGGGGQGDDHSRNVGAGGGGGGYGSVGMNGQSAGDPVSYGGVGGESYGMSDLSSQIYLGSGGGGGGSDDADSGYGGAGGAGGGIVVFAASHMNLQGNVSALGFNGSRGSTAYRTGGGGGGSGGSIYIIGTDVDVSSNLVVARGGNGASGTDKGGTTPKGGDGGDGGIGRIYIEYCDTFSGTTDPPASIHRIDCSIDALRYVRLAAQDYSSILLDLALGESGSRSYEITADVGDDGYPDWQAAGIGDFPLQLSTSDLSSAFESYFSGQDGDVSVPIRFTLVPSMTLRIVGLHTTSVNKPDPKAEILTGGTVGARSVPLSLSLTNSGDADTGPFIVAFFVDVSPEIVGIDEWYIGSTLVPNIRVGETVQAKLIWDYMGFFDDVKVRAVIDPHNCLTEGSEINNEAMLIISLPPKGEPILDKIYLPLVMRKG